MRLRRRAWPDAAYVLGYDAAVALAVKPPYGLVHALTVEHEARILREELYDVELTPGELYGFAVIRDAPVGVVYGQRAVKAHLAGGHVPLFPAQVRVHARGQLAGGEGFDDVVVSSGGKAPELIALLHTRREEDDGAGDVLAYQAADLQPVYVGQPHVQQYQVGLGACGAHGLHARVCAEHVVPALAEKPGEHVGYVPLVVRYQQPVSHCARPPVLFRRQRRPSERAWRRCGGIS